MTHIPTDSRLVFGVPGPRFRPAYVCSHPSCGRTYDLELHHLFPRSFLRGQPRDWVKLPSGREVGNLVWLCGTHHFAISENRTRIWWDEERNDGFHWIGIDADGRLDPQPPLSVSEVQYDSNLRETPRSAPEASREPPTRMYEGLAPLTNNDELTPVGKNSSDFSGPIVPGEKCPACERRVPHPPKPDSPKTTVTKSWRLPAEEKEDREQLLEATAVHLGIPSSTKFFVDKLILALCALALQGPGGVWNE